VKPKGQTSLTLLRLNYPLPPKAPHNRTWSRSQTRRRPRRHKAHLKAGLLAHRLTSGGGGRVSVGEPVTPSPRLFHWNGGGVRIMIMMNRNRRNSSPLARHRCGGSWGKPRVTCAGNEGLTFFCIIMNVMEYGLDNCERAQTRMSVSIRPVLY
jgi:hypothetical protein